MRRLARFFLRELDVYWAAQMFYTRVPVPSIKNYNDSLLVKATRYFPLVGLLVAFLSFLPVLILPLALPGLTNLGLGVGAFPGWLGQILVAVLAIVASLMATGAFHEDGFADLCDGFGGGTSRERVLEIMKDSRLGTYGSAGLFFLLLLKVVIFFGALHMTGLVVWDASILIRLFLWWSSVHALARLVPVLIMLCTDYARDDALAKAKPLAVGVRFGTAWPAFAFGLGPLILCVTLAYMSWTVATLGIVVSAAIFLICHRWFIRVLGGYTGDCLGASEQIAELTLATLFLFTFHWK